MEDRKSNGGAAAIALAASADSDGDLSSQRRVFSYEDDVSGSSSSVSSTIWSPIIYHIPVCPFSQRLEILLELKAMREEAHFQVIDITVPRPDWLLEKTGGTPILPIMDLGEGRILKESIIMMRFIDEQWSFYPVSRIEPYERAMERMFLTRESAFSTAGYMLLMNQDEEKREEKCNELLEQFAWLNEMLMQINPHGTYLFNKFGLAECVYTPMMMRFWFLEHYEKFDLPDEDRFVRVRRWREACVAHPAAQQVTKHQIITLYCDFAVGVPNGKLPEGRTKSSFSLEPHWSERPLPPTDKYDRIASDEELGLL